MKNMFRTVLLSVAFSQLLTSCFTYTDILKKKEVTEDYIFSEKDFEIGNKYEFITKNEMVLELKLNEFSSDGIHGAGTLKTVKGNSQAIHSDAYFLEFEDIEEVKRYKFNPWITALVPAVILVGIGIYVSNNLNIGYTW